MLLEFFLVGIIIAQSLITGRLRRRCIAALENAQKVVEDAKIMQQAAIRVAEIGAPVAETIMECERMLRLTGQGSVRKPITADLPSGHKLEIMVKVALQ